ncbi:hypothetical protein PQC38_gp013 [Aeromonas phage BUCT695]|uniref:hypothetical protein n=1 Tax=Aeromonas phage BUCT695 TaxID=2908630 RepID=UPI00232985EB|nr:hypothetical protein PQC38_gp013 [Aeromonas phage BUCT695]UIW10489.1 hypothetical protein [Aeromonas phage BUCT695]
MKFDAILVVNILTEIEMGKSLRGQIFEDKKSRFPDDTQVVTSSVQGLTLFDGDMFVRTANTIYKIESGTPND